jgi:hypothetical protein
MGAEKAAVARARMVMAEKRMMLSVPFSDERTSFEMKGYV